MTAIYNIFGLKAVYAAMPLPFVYGKLFVFIEILGGCYIGTVDRERKRLRATADSRSGEVQTRYVSDLRFSETRFEAWCAIEAETAVHTFNEDIFCYTVRNSNRK